MDVEIVHWPKHARRRAQLRHSRTPRLLLVERGTRPPVCVDPLEDWVHTDASDNEVENRTDGIRQRAEALGDALLPSTVIIDDNDVVRVGSAWVALSPVEARLFRGLTSGDGVVMRDELLEHGWPGAHPDRNSLDVHMMRLRRRLTPLGINIRTERSSGYELVT